MLVADQDLHLWSALCEKASPGPWAWDVKDDRIRIDGKPWSVVVSGGSIGWENATLLCCQDDVDFIVEARTAVPALIAEVKRLRTLLTEAQR